MIQTVKNLWSQFIGMGSSASRPPSKLSKLCLAEGSADIMMLKTNYVFTPSAPSSDTRTRRYKCNLTNQHICQLFQSSIQTNSTKQDPFCPLNITDQEDMSAWIIFIPISIISSLIILPPSLPSQVASLIFCLASKPKSGLANKQN